MLVRRYELGAQKDPLLRSVLTFATINYADDMPNLAMLQIATNFFLLAIFLSHLIGQVGDRGREQLRTLERVVSVVENLARDRPAWSERY